MRCQKSRDRIAARVALSQATRCTVIPVYLLPLVTEGNKRSGHPSDALSSHRNVIKTFVTGLAGSWDGSLKLPKTVLRHCERMITFLRLTNEPVLSRPRSCIAFDEWLSEIGCVTPEIIIRHSL